MIYPPNGHKYIQDFDSRDVGLWTLHEGCHQIWSQPITSKGVLGSTVSYENTDEWRGKANHTPMERHTQIMSESGPSKWKEVYTPKRYIGKQCFKLDQWLAGMNPAPKPRNWLNGKAIQMRVRWISVDQTEECGGTFLRSLYSCISHVAGQTKKGYIKWFDSNHDTRNSCIDRL